MTASLLYQFVNVTRIIIDVIGISVIILQQNANFFPFSFFLFIKTKDI